MGIWTLELVIDAGMATGIVCPLGNCKSTGKVPDTGLEEGRMDGRMERRKEGRKAGREERRKERTH